MQAVGPVAVTSLLLGSGLKDTINSPVQADPNNPADPEAQREYNMAAIQVRADSAHWLPLSCGRGAALCLLRCREQLHHAVLLLLVRFKVPDV